MTRLYRAPRIARKADADKHIVRTDPHNLLKHFASACRIDKAYIRENMVEIKAHKLRKRGCGTHANNVDAACRADRVNRLLKICTARLLKRAADLFNILAEHLGQNIRIFELIARHVHSLHGGQLVADQFLKRPLKLRITVKAYLRGKAHNC